MIARWKTMAAVLLTTLGLTMGVGVVAAGPAAADSAARGYNCVSNYEYNHFYIGNGKNAVERFIGTRGWLVWQQGNYAVKKYNHCGSYYSIVKIKYYWNGYRWVVANAWRW